MSLKKSVVSAEEAAAKAKAELDGAESKLSLVDGEPVLGENPVRLKHLKANVEKTKEEEVTVQESLEAKEALLARALDENEVSSVIFAAKFFCHSLSVVQNALMLYKLIAVFLVLKLFGLPTGVDHGFHVMSICYRDNKEAWVSILE